MFGRVVIKSHQNKASEVYLAVMPVFLIDGLFQMPLLHNNGDTFLEFFLSKCFQAAVRRLTKIFTNSQISTTAG